MKHHVFRIETESFYIEPAYHSPHAAYKFGGAGCDPAAITDHAAALTLAYLEWFKAGSTGLTFAQAHERANNFFGKANISRRSLASYLEILRKGKSLTRWDVETATSQEVSGAWFDMVEKIDILGSEQFTAQLLALADVYEVFAPLLFAWVGAEIPLSHLKKRGAFVPPQAELDLETATQLKIFYSEAAVFSDSPAYRLDVARTLERFERQVKTCVLSLKEKLPFLDVSKVVLERVSQKVPFKFKFQTQVWFPFGTTPIYNLVKRELGRRLTTWFVFVSPQEHCRAMRDKEGFQGYSLAADLMDAYGLSAFEARVIWHTVTLADDRQAVKSKKNLVDRYQELLHDFCCGIPYQQLSEGTLDLAEFNAFNLTRAELSNAQDVSQLIGSLNRTNVNDFNHQLAARLVSMLLSNVPVYTVMYLANVLSTENWEWWGEVGLRGKSYDEVLTYLVSVYKSLTQGGQRAFWSVVRDVYLSRRDTDDEEDPEFGAGLKFSFFVELPCPFCGENMAEFEKYLRTEKTDDGFTRKAYVSCPRCNRESLVIFNSLEGLRLTNLKGVKQVILTCEAAGQQSEHYFSGPDEAFEFLQVLIEMLSDPTVSDSDNEPELLFDLGGLIVWASETEVKYCAGWHRPMYYDSNLPRIVMPDGGVLDDILSGLLASREAD